VARSSARGTSLHLFGSVVRETILETIAGLLACGALSGVLPARGPFVAENLIAHDGVDLLRLLFPRALLFDPTLLFG